MTEETPHPALGSILANLGDEISRPLGELRNTLGRIVRSPGAATFPKQHNHASTMIILCEEIDRLTAETLGARGSPD